MVVFDKATSPGNYARPLEQHHFLQLATQLLITLIACEMHCTSNSVCKNYELMKNGTFHFEHVRLNNTEL